MKVAAHHADVVFSSQLLKLLARSSPVARKLMNFADSLAFQVDQMRARLAFWLEQYRIDVFRVNRSIRTDGCRINDGHIQINAAATTSLTDHLKLRYPLLVCFFVPANHAMASIFFILSSASAAIAATTAPKRKVISAPLLCHSAPATAPENMDAIPTEP